MTVYLLKNRATMIWVVLVTLTIVSLEFLQGLTIDGKHQAASINSDECLRIAGRKLGPWEFEPKY